MAETEATELPHRRITGRTARLVAPALAAALTFSALTGVSAATAAPASAGSPVAASVAAATSAQTFSMALPKVSGTLQAGRTLTATPGSRSVSGTSLSYQWYRAKHVLPGATGRSYTLKDSDVGATFTVHVTAKKSGYSTIWKGSARTKVVASRVAKIRAEMNYVYAHWNSRSSSTYGYLADSDCVNFASQVLKARGWSETSNWWTSKSSSGRITYGSAWISSTALMNFMKAHPSRGKALSDSQRSKVKVGDIVQFDWDRSGDRDHTGIVSRVDKRPNGTYDIYYAGHTTHTQYRAVDNAITKIHPGGRAYYWSLP